MEDIEFDAQLKFIAPKGNEEQGTVQFKVEGDVFLDDKVVVRAGYSANASLVIEKKDSIMVFQRHYFNLTRRQINLMSRLKAKRKVFKKKD